MKQESLKIVAISDIHGYLPCELPEGEVLCICGDIMPLHVQNDMIESIAWLCREFFPWVEKQPFCKVIFTWGNHDFVGEYLATDRHGNHRKPKRVLKKLLAPSKLVLLEDSEFIYKGYRFWGSPWCPELSNWAFYGDHNKLINKFSKIPENVDVLLTHAAPRIDSCGIVQQPGYNYMADFGCQELAEAVLEKKPKVHIFGHIHSGRHNPYIENGTTFINVSLKDEGYEPTYWPTIIEL